MNPATPLPRNRRLLVIILGALVVVAALVAGMFAMTSGSKGPYSVVDDTITIEVATVGALGSVLVTDQGFALYMFPPDEQSSVTCEDRCAVNWPPIIVPPGVTLAAGKGVDASLLSETIAKDGSRVASYDGWPLYTYLGDISPGTATGQAQFLDGGYWYVVRPNGEVVKPGPQQ